MIAVISWVFRTLFGVNIFAPFFVGSMTQNEMTILPASSNVPLITILAMPTTRAGRNVARQTKAKYLTRARGNTSILRRCEALVPNNSNYSQAYRFLKSHRR